MPIFWRLICGYLLILLLSLVISSYSVVQLGRLSNAAHTALNAENRMIGYEERLTDVFLSEVRYAGKYIITHASPLHDQLRQFKGDFVRYLHELKALAESSDVKARLSRVEEFHSRYHELFDQEVRYVKARQSYAVTRYREEKEKVLESLLGELDRLKAHLQKQLQDKLETIEIAARTSRAIAIASTLALLGFGIALAFAMSRSIVKPLSELSRMTEHTEDSSDYGADFSTMPEIHDLAVALSKARRKLGDASRTNAVLVRSITDQFATPLVSVNKRLGYLREQLSQDITTEQAKHIEILAAEVERLITRFAQLSQSTESPVDVGHDAQSDLRKSEPKASERRRLDSAGSFVRRIRSLIASARETGTGSWNVIRGSIATLGYRKGEKR